MAMASVQSVLDDEQFNISTRFKVTNIQQIFDPKPGDILAKSHHTETFGPRLNISLVPNKSDPPALGIYLHISSHTMSHKRPLNTHYSFTASSFSGHTWYQSRSCCHAYTTAHGFRTFLTTQDWQTHKSLRDEDGFILHVTARSLPVPTPKSLPVLDVLHRTLSDFAANDVHFTLFDGRSSMGVFTKESGRGSHCTEFISQEGCVRPASVFCSS